MKEIPNTLVSKKLLKKIQKQLIRKCKHIEEKFTYSDFEKGQIRAYRDVIYLLNKQIENIEKELRWAEDDIKLSYVISGYEKIINEIRKEN